MENFKSRRSPIYAKNGMVATSQPLASEIGLSILKKGGNAADAAVAVAATLNVTEPTSTGIGGDAFALFYDATNGKVKGINGSGRAPAALSLQYLKDQGIDKLDPLSIHTVTVPGAAAAWVDTVERFGRLSVKEVLTPAMNLARDGFPVAPITAHYWQRGTRQLKRGPNANEMLLNGAAPKVGEIMQNPTLADTFATVIKEGKEGYYSGRIADAIIDLMQQFGGVMTHEDLAHHHSTFDEPITVDYRGVDVFEIPPNGQGITALMGLNILENFDITELQHSSPEHLHVLIETMRLAFADTRWYVADPAITDVPITALLSKEYAKQRSKLIDPTKATVDAKRGSPTSSSDTVYFSVVDGDGNACSFINSNYMGFGTGLIPKGTGFTLQNRGHNFSLNHTHPNRLEPNKRPYHTIIPGMATKDGELYSSFGVMGGFMQPQGHMQVISNMVDFRYNPQQALDAPRFAIGNGTAGGSIHIEEGVAFSTLAKLAKMGHTVIPEIGYGRSIFGRGQIITKLDTGALVGGSDPRADGLAIGY